MARRLALLLFVAVAAAVHRPLSSSEDFSASEPDPFVLWDDYDDSRDTTLRPRIQTTPLTKVILRGKKPKVNVTVKHVKGEDKKVIKTTNINIESHTNFIVTKAPPFKPNGVKKRPENGQYIIVEAPDEYVTRATTKKPTTRRPPSTRRPTTRRPATTRRPTTRPLRRTTKAPPTKKTTCPPKNEWLSSFFKNDKIVKKTQKRPATPGFFSTIYDWIIASQSWFIGSWFTDAKPKKPPVTTTTASPPTTPTTSWFQNFLDTEDSNDGAYLASDTSTNKKSAKKPLKKHYKGYQLLRTFPDAKWKVKDLLELREEAYGSGLMWWNAPSLNGSTDLLVPPDLLADVKAHLKSSKIDFDVEIWDLQKAIMYENPRLSKKQRIELEQIRGHPMTWRRYHRYADILRYLEYLQHSHSDVVELIPLGRSSEGLPLVAVKISLPTNDTLSKDTSSKDGKKKWKLRSRMKPAVWVDGGVHAREWIAPAVATWMINALVEGENGLGGDLEALKQADFYIMPVMNPDGYEHSHTHDRLWMKTRSRTDHADDYYVGWFPWNWGQTECVGVDADRNWDYRWGEQESSKDPCSDNYAGSHPFSEPETRAVSQFLAEHKGLIKVFISLHAYSQAWLTPSEHALAPTGDEGILMEMGKLATAALSDMYGTKYQVGTAAEIRQPASGMAHDWAKARAGILFSYHVDMRDSFGPYGFLLPGSQIVSTARETWQAVRTIVDNLSSTP